MIKSLLRTGSLLAALHGAVAYGQNAQPVIPLTGSPPTPVSGSNPLPVSGTFSATVGGFQPSAAGARGTPLAVTTSDSSGALPTGTVIITSNPGANLMYCNVNGVAATASDQPITSGGGWFAFTLPTGATTLHCIAPGGATTANTLGGTGLPTGTGGGGGGGGGGGSSVVFGPTAAGNPAANPPVLMGGTVDGTAAGNVANWKVLAGIGSVNTAQVNGIATLAGAGAVGTGSQRVAVGQDATTLAGSALGLTVGSPLFVTPGTGASFAVTQATAASLNATVVGTGTFAVQAAAILNAETTKVIGTVRNLGNAGAITDFAGQNASSPANAWLMGAQFQTTPTTITPGNASPLQMDNAGNLLVNVKAGGAGGGAATIADGADVTQGSKADAATCVTTNTVISCLRQIDADIKGSIPNGTNVISLGDAALGSTVDVPCSSLPLTSAPCTIDGAMKELVNLANTPAQITSLPAAARHFGGCAVTLNTSSVTCLAGATAVTFLQVQNVSATANVACTFGGTAALNTGGSFMLASGVPANWGPSTGGVPTGALNCISSAASTPLYVEWN